MCAFKNAGANVSGEWEYLTTAEILDLHMQCDNQDYFKEHYLRVYLDDAVSQMLSIRLESNNIKPSKFLKEYFCSVHQGTHILFREYDYISATPYNRLCVLKAIMQIYKSLLFREEKYTANDYHSLLQLVWPDLPFEVVNAAFLSLDQTDDGEAVHLSCFDFIKAFKSTFCALEYDYEASIIDSQIRFKLEETMRIIQRGDRCYLSEADFLPYDENVSDQASSWSVTSNFIPNSEFKRILSLKESNSFSSDEPACEKLSRSSSGSKDASKSEQNVFRTSTSAICGRLGGKQLSNSLTLLQTEKLDTENHFSIHRHRSKSAVTIPRTYQQTKP